MSAVEIACTAEGLPLAGIPSPAVSAQREAVLSRLRSGVDMIVLGAGVNGTAIAWEAALRGLHVLLVDKQDIGAGTSSWSSRMIHGGLKYLEHLDVALVRESLREREWLLRAAPHLVRPLRFVLPFYDSNVHPRAVLELGMLAYDALSADKSVPTHRLYRRAGVLRRYPGLSTDGLQGGAAYFDCQAEYTERLVTALVGAARAAGARVLPYAPATRIRVADGQVLGVTLRDRLTGTEHDVDSPLVVNAAGPWVDELFDAALPGQSRLIGGTRGSHFVVDPFPGAPADAMYYEAVQDGRPLMVIPWLGSYLIGSTDLRFDGDLDTVRSSEEELDYVLRETNRLFPAAGLTPASVRYSYCGVRPLPWAEGGKTGDVTRRHSFVAHPQARGLHSVVGGKLTTFRSLAEDFFRTLEPPHRRSWSGRRAVTWRLRLPGAGVRPDDPTRLQERFGVSVQTADRLLQLYGRTAFDVLAPAADDPALLEVVDPATGTVAAQVRWAVTEEQATTLTDVLARRLVLIWRTGLAVDAVGAVGAALVRHCGWSPERVATEAVGYRHYLRRFEP